MTQSHPYLSMVTTSRNDGHGGDLLGRMNIHISSFVDQCKQYDLDAEIIIVEWNPPDDRPGLAEVLKWPNDLGPVTVRIIPVPNEIHRTLKHSEALPLYQMIAKNVGIRRARGEFVLATNVDIVFSDPLFRYLAKRKLSKQRMYRVDRHDIDAGVPFEATTEERLNFCSNRNHVLRIHKREGSEILADGSFSEIYPDIGLLLVKAIGTRLLGSYGERKLGIPREYYWNKFKFHRKIGRLHTNGCGDFTLLAKDAWFSVRGYAEKEMYSFHIDSLFCHAAHTAGYREKVLERCPTYHIEQTSGAAFQPEQQEKLWNRLEEAKIGRMTDDEIWAEVIALRAGKKSPVYNDQNWGLIAHDLQEIVV